LAVRPTMSPLQICNIRKGREAAEVEGEGELGDRSHEEEEEEERGPQSFGGRKEEVPPTDKHFIILRLQNEETK
jgi:hypothetical protein